MWSTLRLGRSGRAAAYGQACARYFTSTGWCRYPHQAGFTQVQAAIGIPVRRADAVDDVGYGRPVAVQRAFLHSTRPVAGIADTIRNTYDAVRGGAQDKQEQLVFEKQMEMLQDAARPFDGNRFLDYLSQMKHMSGLGGFREHLPWTQNNPALGELKDQMAIVQAMSPAERSAVHTLTIGARKRIARSTGQDLDSVESIISQIGVLRDIQRWLLRRQREGLPLPQSSNELRNMLSTPGSGISRRPQRQSGRNAVRPGVKHR